MAYLCFLVSASAKKNKKRNNAEVIGTDAKKYFLNLKVGYSWKLCSKGIRKHNLPKKNK